MNKIYNCCFYSKINLSLIFKDWFTYYTYCYHQQTVKNDLQQYKIRVIRSIHHQHEPVTIP